MKKYDKQRLIIAGDRSCGKTALVTAFCHFHDLRMLRVDSKEIIKENQPGLFDLILFDDIRFLKEITREETISIFRLDRNRRMNVKHSVGALYRDQTRLILTNLEYKFRKDKRALFDKIGTTKAIQNRILFLQIEEGETLFATAEKIDYVDPNRDKSQLREKQLELLALQKEFEYKYSETGALKLLSTYTIKCKTREIQE